MGKTVAEKVHEFVKEVNGMVGLAQVCASWAKEHPSTCAASWRAFRAKVTQVEWALRTVRAAVQSNRTASSKRCEHQGTGHEYKRVEYVDGVKVEKSWWRCKWCDSYTSVKPLLLMLVPAAMLAQGVL